CAKSSRLGVWGVRRVVDDAKVEAQLSHVDALGDGIAFGLSDLVAGVEIRTRLHLDHRVAALVVEVEVVEILEERASDGDRALVGGSAQAVVDVDDARI